MLQEDEMLLKGNPNEGWTNMAARIGGHRPWRLVSGCFEGLFERGNVKLRSKLYSLSLAHLLRRASLHLDLLLLSSTNP